VSGLRVLALFGQMKHCRSDNEQTRIIATELANGGTLYKKEIFFNIFIRLPYFILSIIPVWLLIKHVDDFKDIEDCDVIVVSGKKMIKFAKHIRHYMFPNTKIVQIGNPVCAIRKNDILIRQETSRFIYTGKNTIKVNGLLCDKIDDTIYQENSEKFSKIKETLSGDFIGVFIGGDRYRYKFTVYNATAFAKLISKIAHNMQMSLLIAIDGKLNKETINALKQNLDCSYYFFEKQKNTESPKIAFMNWSKYYILHGNIINDQSEYIAQGKPTYVYLTKENRKRYLHFIEVAVKNGSIRILSDDSEEVLKDFVPTKMNDIKNISEQIKSML